ncbi:MAG: hypothetical protein IPH53_14675 [Flavobacteriales bacterium]|nr:hypothetical protein [Flavobacteriales bacterium]
MDTDTDGDLVADCIDTCPLIPGQIGTACDDGDAYTSSDQLNGSCICQGTCPGTTLALDLTTDNNASQTSWEIIPQGGGAPLATGSGYANLSNVIVDHACPQGATSCVCSIVVATAWAPVAMC